MRIKPSHADFEKWIDCVPLDGDLIFLSEANSHLLADQPFERFTRHQSLTKGKLIWTLNARSWYGYTLSQADYCVWLPKGAVESFDQNLRSRLEEEQRNLKVPTVIKKRWITSWQWGQISREEKIQTLQLWFIQNEVDIYESLDFSDLSEAIRLKLVRAGFDKLLNRYASFSGPNCFATAAAGITGNKEIFNQWMHWPELESILNLNNFGVIASDGPLAGDILVFNRNETPIHAAYCLGEDSYFEKPGQDFYEPYRIAILKDWKTAWPNSKLRIYRKLK